MTTKFLSEFKIQKTDHVRIYIRVGFEFGHLGLNCPISNSDKCGQSNSQVQTIRFMYNFSLNSLENFIEQFRTIEFGFDHTKFQS